MKIKQKLSIMIVVLLILCISATVGVSNSMAKKNIEKLTEASIQENLKMYQSVIDLKIQKHFAISNLFAADRRIVEGVTGVERTMGPVQIIEPEQVGNQPQNQFGDFNNQQMSINEELMSEVESNPEVENIMIVNLDGEIVMSAQESVIGDNVSEREYFSATINKGMPYVGFSMASRDTGEQVVPICVPIIDEEGNTVGMISTIIVTNKIAEELKSAKILGTENTYPMLLDQKGVLIVHPNAEYVGKLHEDENIRGIALKLASNSEEIIGELSYQSMSQGTERVMRYIEVSQADWLLGISIDQGELMQPIKDMQKGGLVILVVSLLIGMIAAYLYVQSISKPLGKIEGIVRKLAGLDLSDSEDLHKLRRLKDEVGTMAEATATTTEALKKVVSELIQYAEQTMISAQTVDNLASYSLEESEQTVVVVEELSASMEEINASTEEVSSTVESINGNIRVITDHIGKSSQLALNIARNSETIKDKTIQDSEIVKASYNDVKNNMELALKKAEVISQIYLLVESIESITKQTNLLALNASIEAARAGDVGRGFGVVAHEIGALASESGNAVTKIQEVIALVMEATNEMRDSAQESLAFMEKQIDENVENTLENAKSYMTDANEVYSALQELEQRSHELTQYSQIITETIDGIAIAISENTQGVVNIASQTNNINKNINEIKEQSMTNKSVAEQLSEVASRFTI